MRTLRSFTLLAITSTAMTFSVPAFGNTLILNVLNPFQTVTAGQTVTFNATVTASASNVGDIFLNSDQINVADANSVFTVDDTDFFVNFPLFLSPGASVTDAIFTVTNNGPVTEAYTGSFVLLGGSDGNAADVLATATFGSPVVTAPVPEPSSMPLLGTGLFGILFLGKRRFAKSRFLSFTRSRA